MSTVLAVLVAAVVAFVLSGGYYASLATRLARWSPAYAGEGRPAATTAAVELARNLVLAGVVAWLADGLGTDGAGQGLLLSLMLWSGFPVVLLAGSVFHERVHPALATTHAGDWLLKLAAICLVITLWP